MKAAWFNCFAGVAGDMALGALIDAGADVNKVSEQLASLGIGQWTLDTEITERAGIRATRVVITGAEDDTVSRPFRTIRALLDEAALPTTARDRSMAVFTRLAEVEAFIHRTDTEHVHFHEVGGIDSVLDIVGTCLALDQLEIEALYCSPIATGYGTVESAHGTLPVPAPAVVRLLQGVPVSSVDQRRELTTPTGAALMTTLATSFGPLPSFRSVLASGYGAGSADLAGLPNCTQVVIGEFAPTDVPVSAQGDPVLELDQAVVIEANIDDATGEVIAHALNQLLANGAHDAWITPIVMKKGRPAHTLSALCAPHDVGVISAVLMNETGSFGVRSYAVDKAPATRRFETVDVRGDTVAMKVGGHRAKAEFDDAARLAQEQALPVRQVIAEAEATWRQQPPESEA